MKRKVGDWLTVVVFGDVVILKRFVKSFLLQPADWAIKVVVAVGHPEVGELEAKGGFASAGWATEEDGHWRGFRRVVGFHFGPFALASASATFNIVIKSPNSSSLT